MTWDEMIQLRRHKERNHLNPFALAQKGRKAPEELIWGLSLLERSALQFRFFSALPIASADQMGILGRRR
jgi:hypothetical protein